MSKLSTIYLLSLTPKEAYMLKAFFQNPPEESSQDVEGLFRELFHQLPDYDELMKAMMKENGDA